jgi:hypothetical protein
MICKPLSLSDIIILEAVMMTRIVVVGGGLAGCSAAASAARAGANVVLIEMTDDLGGQAQLAGPFRIGGQFRAHEEAIAMGGGDIPMAMDSLTMFTEAETHGHHHVHIYDCRKLPEALEKTIRALGVDIRYRSRVSKVQMSGNKIQAVSLDNGDEFEADACVDATGTAGPMSNCRRYGHGCVSCITRCPTFGGRVSLAAKAGVKEWVGVQGDGSPGVYSAAFALCKETLSSEIQRGLEQKGFLALEIPKEIRRSLYEGKESVATEKYPKIAERLNIAYTGWVHVLVSYMTLEELHTFRGFENALYVSPYTGWIGNSIRYMAITPRDNTLKVNGVENLFVAGEKIGGSPNGVTDVSVIGMLAGHNAARKALGMDLLELSRDTAVGDFIAYTGEHQEELSIRHSFIFGVYLERMKQTGLYTRDVQQIHKCVEDAGLAGVFSEKLTV